MIETASPASAGPWQVAARRARVPAAIFVVCAAAYTLTLGDRIRGLSDNAHFVYLAQSFLSGQLEVVGNRPPGNNDWAFYGGQWYVSFPPLPALVIMPAVAIWGLSVWDRLFWAIFAGLGPALIYVLLRSLREQGLSAREPREDLAYTALFAFGSVYFFTAVQGTVWFSAHVVAVPVVALYVLGAIRARRPFFAGCMLGLAFITRPSTMFLAALFLIEALDVSRRTPPTAADRELEWGARAVRFLRSVDYRAALPKLFVFALPILLIGGITMLFNQARFDDPFEFGHSHLRIRWSARIEKWGLANYHYLSKNLAVFLAALPWISAASPYVKISRHGLALWVTTPHYLGVLWPRRTSVTQTALALAAVGVALIDLCYQNSGWIQFGYRFSLDYAVLLIALLALGARKQTWTFHAFLVVAIAINLFGAITFDRIPIFYDQDPTQQVIFQPD